MYTIKLPSEEDASMLVQALRMIGKHHLAGYIVQQLEHQNGHIIDDAKLVREVKE
jgi:hypothetical protein